MSLYFPFCESQIPTRRDLLFIPNKEKFTKKKEFLYGKWLTMKDYVACKKILKSTHIVVVMDVGRYWTKLYRSGKMR